MESSSGDVRAAAVEDVCGAVDMRAAGLGHRLGGWDDCSEGSVLARRTRCSICGEVAYVRVEDGLVGATGAAVTAACPGRRTA